jgi:hypothetical protein
MTKGQGPMLNDQGPMLNDQGPMAKAPRLKSETGLVVSGGANTVYFWRLQNHLS